MSTFYVTTPIYYVNDKPHIGHAYTTTAADVVSRFHRQLGDDVFFLTGTDEHGTKVEQAALERGVSPKQHADENAGKFQEVARKMNATNTFFIRTTDAEHERFVQDFVQRCYDAGDIYRHAYSGLYCPACEAYYTEDQLNDGLCPDHGIRPTWMEEQNWFFRLSAYQDRLASHYRHHPDFVRPRHRYNEALSFIEQGLEDISISRATLKWGIPVPWDGSQVIYVWVDALINYLSALHYAPGADLVQRFWPATYHLMAQDILKFHGIIWPALLLSAGYDLPQHLFIHGYLKLGGEKMSKTRGNVMDPFPLIERYGPDPFRFYCFREVNFGQDGMVGEESFKSRYNTELANDLGNLLSRTVSMIGKYRGGRIPAWPAGRGDSPLALEALEASAVAKGRLEAMELTAALETMWGFVRRLNRYVEEQAPWKLAKESADEELDATLHNLAEGLRVLAVMLHAFMPGTSRAIYERLGMLGAAGPTGRGSEASAAPSSAAAPLSEVEAEERRLFAWNAAGWGGLPEGLHVVQGPPLFPRIEE